ILLPTEVTFIKGLSVELPPNMLENPIPDGMTIWFVTSNVGASFCFLSASSAKSSAVPTIKARSSNFTESQQPARKRTVNKNVNLTFFIRTNSSDFHGGK